MSILQPRLPGARVVDLCAGSGALGLETLSRGAAHVTFVERDPRVRRVLHQNIAALGAEPRSAVVGQDAVHFVETLGDAPFDLALADPPYAADTAAVLVTRWLVHPFATELAVEHPAGVVLPGDGDMRRYGTSAITFYRRNDPPQERP